MCSHVAETHGDWKPRWEYSLSLKSGRWTTRVHLVAEMNRSYFYLVTIEVYGLRRDLNIFFVCAPFLWTQTSDWEGVSVLFTLLFSIL